MNDNKPLNINDPLDALTVIMTAVGDVPLVMEANTVIRASEKTLKDFITLHTLGNSEDQSILNTVIDENTPFEPEVNNGTETLEATVKK